MNWWIANIGLQSECICILFFSINSSPSIFSVYCGGLMHYYQITCHQRYGTCLIYMANLSLSLSLWLPLFSNMTFCFIIFICLFDCVLYEVLNMSWNFLVVFKGIFCYVSWYFINEVWWRFIFMVWWGFFLVYECSKGAVLEFTSERIVRQLLVVSFFSFSSIKIGLVSSVPY